MGDEFEYTNSSPKSTTNSPFFGQHKRNPKALLRAICPSAITVLVIFGDARYCWSSLEKLTIRLEVVSI
ncbi:hypothetical protein F2P79_024408 [Pimephales promelas]|nr:hypothetical protein F2P79_024408 [Pimephales promelas]